MRSKHSSRILSVLLALVMVLTVLPTMVFAEGEKSDDVVVLYTNDVHCGVDNGTPAGTMGYANVAAYKKAMEATYNYVTLMDAGDAIQGEAIGTLSNGSYLIDIMNQVGYDYATFGNHEFDYGMPVALSLLEKSNATYLSCNFTDLKTGKTVAEPYAIETYGDLKVAYIGISTPETFTKSTPTYFQDAEGNYIYGFCEGNNGKDLYDAVQASIDAAAKEGADVIVALGHCGIDEQSAPWRSTDIIANTTGLDAFIDGHSHSTIAGEAVKDQAGKDVILTSTGTKLNNLGKMVITPEGEITTELVSGYNEVDTETDAFIKNIEAQYQDKLNEVVAKTDVTLTISNPETGKRAVRSAETNLGDLCADAYRTVLGADIAFVNGGGVRVDIPAGDITYGQIIAVHPFGNMACVVEATGQEIVDALEHASRSTPGENGGFLQVSGLKYTIDLNVASSVKTDDKSMFVSVEGLRRVKNVQVLNDNGEYEPIDLDATYTLASHNYMLKSGGDGINMFMDNKILQDEVMIDNQVLITFIRDHLDGVVGEEYSNPYGEGRINVTDMPFTDVPENRFFYEPVQFVDGQGYMIGITDTLFAPNMTLDRATVATVLYRLAGEPAVMGEAPFSDVVKGSFYENAVVWASATGIVKGYPDGRFCPKQAITRQEMVTMFYRYAQVAGMNTEKAADLSSFADSDTVKSYAQQAMQWAVSVGLIYGMENNTLQPRALSTRGQFATVVYRFLTSKVDINVMATSDVHGQIYATDYTADYTASGTYHQSLTRVATFVQEQRDLYENTFLADCGDLLQGTPLTYYYCFSKTEEEDPAMKALRMMGYDMFVPGNHEFNYGMKILQSRLSYLTSDATETESSVAVSCANYLAAATNNDETKDWTTWNGYAPYALYDFDGVTVAVMGIGNPNVAKWDVPANWEGIYFANPIETYKHYEQEMTEKADLIVLMSHSGIDSDEDSDFIRRLISETNTIDLVFSGHEHRNGVTSIENTDGVEIPVISPGTKANAVGQSVITYDKVAGSYTITAASVPMSYRDENRVWQANYEVDEAMEAALKPYETATWEEYMLQPIGKADGDFSAANLGGAPSAFVDLVNKVQIWGAYDRTGENTPDDKTDDTPAQLSITAPLTSGSAVNLIPAGDIVLGDMFKLYRYENWFYQITMTGKEVDTWLEYSASKVKVEEDGSVTILGGLTYYDVIYGQDFSYVIDPSKPEGERVTISYKGEAVADDAVFTVVVNNYRYNGGGNYIQYLNDHGCEFTPNDPDRIIYSTQYDMIQGEDKGQARNLLADYIREAGTISPVIESTWSIIIE
ncbi:MAG: 5'-nucleotidase C-terminal domain-containing protein [Candidatus Faecousia sp.]|nr:5'-nucleotidase C-terminal domain-containing protein [Bacillota bacterium]MDY4220451.1 5'-nucleotidase C-terminal domain-containing protein [Candidatus Faecousia sp.]